MRKVSSDQTFFWKRIFPIFFFGGFAIVIAIMISETINGNTPIPLMLFILLIACFGYLIMRSFVFCLADEVYINDNDIIIINNRREIKFPIRNIMHVESPTPGSFDIVTLTLQNPTEFGTEICFSPTSRMFWLTRHPIATELIQKKNEANKALHPTPFGRG